MPRCLGNDTWEPNPIPYSPDLPVYRYPHRERGPIAQNGPLRRSGRRMLCGHAARTFPTLHLCAAWDIHRPWSRRSHRAAVAGLASTGQVAFPTHTPAASVAGSSPAPPCHHPQAQQGDCYLPQQADAHPRSLKKIVTSLTRLYRSRPAQRTPSAPLLCWKRHQSALATQRRRPLGRRASPPRLLPGLAVQLDQVVSPDRLIQPRRSAVHHHSFDLLVEQPYL